MSEQALHRAVSECQLFFGQNAMDELVAGPAEQGNSELNFIRLEYPGRTRFPVYGSRNQMVSSNLYLFPPAQLTTRKRL